MKVSQPNGSKFVYTGQISNGQANGQGTLSFTEGPYKGDSYLGPFKNNNFHTEGSLLLSFKNSFVHTYTQNNSVSGNQIGRYTTSAGEVYEGSYDNTIRKNLKKSRKLHLGR